MEVRARVLVASAAPPAPEVRVEVPFDGVVLGLTAGDDVDMRSKRAPNEDSVAAVALPDGVVAVVADAHFGPASSELAVDLFARRLKRQPDLPLAELVRGVAQSVENDDLSRGRSETTLLAVRLSGRSVEWVAIGDSQLISVASDGTATLLSTSTGGYVGQYGLAASLPTEPVRLPLEEGARLLLATDGIEPESSGMTLADVGRALVAEPPERAVHALLRRAGSHLQGGGGDNLGVALLLAD